MTEKAYRIHDLSDNYVLCTMELGGGEVWCVLREPIWRGRIEGIEFESEADARKYFDERAAKR